MIFAEGIVLYHGGYTRVETPELVLCREGKDFGRGFYLTSDKDQAKRFVRQSVRKAITTGRVSGDCSQGCVSVFQVESVAGLACYDFPNANEEWLHCVVAHRKKIAVAMEPWAAYDVMEGKIANDATNIVINAYMRGLYGKVGSSQAVQAALSYLEPGNLKDQICLRTAKGLASVRFVGSEEVAL